MTDTTTATTAPAVPYTDAEATDEAVLILVRRLGRRHPEALAEVLRGLPTGARDALWYAEARADRVRDAVKAGGPARRYMTDAERYNEADGDDTDED
jgi:hypothetical protein